MKRGSPCSRPAAADTEYLTSTDEVEQIIILVVPSGQFQSTWLAEFRNNPMLPPFKKTN